MVILCGGLDASLGCRQATQHVRLALGWGPACGCHGKTVCRDKPPCQPPRRKIGEASASLHTPVSPTLRRVAIHPATAHRSADPLVGTDCGPKDSLERATDKVACGVAPVQWGRRTLPALTR